MVVNRPVSIRSDENVTCMTGEVCEENFAVTGSSSVDAPFRGIQYHWA